MKKLYVIRHAQVEIDPEFPPEKWVLSREGMNSLHKLLERENLNEVSCIFHSPELKAVQTAKILGRSSNIPTKLCHDLREVTMTTGYLPAMEFQSRIGNYLSGNDDTDFEDYKSAQIRIVNCVRKIVESSREQSVAIVSHGRIITVLFSYFLGYRLGLEEWKSIGMPDLSVINLDTQMVERGFLSGRKLFNSFP